MLVLPSRAWTMGVPRFRCLAHLKLAAGGTVVGYARCVPGTAGCVVQSLSMPVACLILKKYGSGVLSHQ